MTNQGMDVQRAARRMEPTELIAHHKIKRMIIGMANAHLKPRLSLAKDPSKYVCRLLFVKTGNGEDTALDAVQAAWDAAIAAGYTLVMGESK